jgi:hypothetical protein
MERQSCGVVGCIRGVRFGGKLTFYVLKDLPLETCKGILNFRHNLGPPKATGYYFLLRQ